MNRKKQKDTRKTRIRSKVRSNKERFRLSVYRSNCSIYAQIIDDKKAITMVSASDREIDTTSKMVKSEKARMVGILIAKKAKAKKVTKVVFDRGSYAYHGRVKQLAEGAREGGLTF